MIQTNVPQASNIAPSAELLIRMLEWLRRLLLWHVDVTRATYGELADDDYRGLYIPQAEIEIFGRAPVLPAALADARERLSAERAQIAELTAELVTRGIEPPLARLARLFGLGQFEQDTLLLALAPELDPRFERVIAYIQDDVSRRRPAVDLALRLFCASPIEQLYAQSAFEGAAPLVRQRLIQLVEDGQRRAPLLARFIKLDDRIVAELRGRATGSPIAIDPVIAPFVRSEPARTERAPLCMPSQLPTQLRHAVSEQMVVVLQGAYGSGRRALASATCATLGLPLLQVRLAAVGEPESTGLSPLELCERIVREALLRDAVLLWEGADRLLADDAPEAWRRALLSTLASTGIPSILATERSWEAHGDLGERGFARIELPELSYSDREQIWRQRLGPHAPDDGALAALASTFRLSGGQIRDAVRMAGTFANQRGQAGPLLPDIYAACRAQSSGRLATLAHKISASYSWEDIVLPSDQVAALREICVQVRHRRTVLGDWDFETRLALGKGVNVLFAGPSGTGKTMAAEIIAADLGLELYKIDLSSMVSKYIGETEKNLEQVFRAAREANAILFFDEADALFGKRSEVKDAHDRYANIEVGYLLQKMEEYDGVLILATNLRKNLDDAFARRLHVAIDFPFPEELDRLRIWRMVFPSKAPLAEDVDQGYLARQFKLAGGNIRNIALLAAYLAADDGTPIGMAQLARAIKREYQKIGKMVTESEFGPYLGHVRDPQSLGGRRGSARRIARRRDE